MLKLQYFGHLMQRADSLEKILMLEKIEGGEKKGMTEDEMVKDREAWSAAVQGVAQSQTEWVTKQQQLLCYKREHLDAL